jgi:putative nucleotidyltransferase with HDIG domain
LGDKSIILSTFFREVSDNRRLAGYAIGLAAIGGALAAVCWLLEGGLSAPIWVLGLLSGVAILAERQPVRITRNTEITVAVLPMLFAAVVYGPVDAMAVGAVGVIADFRAPYLRWLVWTAMRSLAGGCAGLAALSFDHGSSAGQLLAAVTAAALADAVVDSVLGGTTVALRGTGSWRTFVLSVRPLFVSCLALYVPLISLLVYSFEQVGAWTVLLFFAPAFAAQSLYRLYCQERESAARLMDVNQRLERANLSFATALVATLDARDQYTAGHSAAVAVYARDIAERMGLTLEQQKLAHLCGLVHDIGKIGLPPGLLDKPGALTLEERRQMETHSAIGEGILANVDDYAEIARIVRHHHERMDGEGYPDGLGGHEIPLISRIISVADAYNAMTSDRPYRDAMPSRVARLRLAQAVESQFDTSVVAAFEAILTAAEEDYRAGLHSSFALERRASMSREVPKLVAAV